MRKITIHFKTSILLLALLLISALVPHRHYHLLAQRQLISERIASSRELSSSGQGSDLAQLPIANISSDSQTDDDKNITPPLDPDEEREPETPAWDANIATNLVIKAINPGYSVDGKRDVGELIELQKLTTDPLALEGYELRYTNTSGTTATIISFPAGSIMNGDTLLLRLARTANGEADATYNTTLALSAGPLELWQGDTIVDTVCWTGKEECQAPFKSNTPTTLVRDLKTGEFVHTENYEPIFDLEHPSLFLPPEPDDSTTDKSSVDSTIVPAARCRGLEFSEILSYYADNKDEQFVELHNPTDQSLQLDGCTIRYKKKTYPLSSVINPDAYYTFRPNEAGFSLTKNPNSSNLLELVDADGKVVDSLTYNHGQKKSTAYAQFYGAGGEETWLSTYAPTPGSANVYQEYRSCPEGKVINPATGNCVKSLAASIAPAECPAGKYRNPLTGRCKSIETQSELAPCKEGYERNPETNRCRKIKSENDGADYALTPLTYSDRSSFIAFGIVAGLVSLGLIYIVFQFRREILIFLRKIRQRLHHARKSLFARKVNRCRHK